MSSIRVVGLKELTKKINKVKNPNKFFNPEVLKVAREGKSHLIANTNIDTGNTRRAWKGPRKINDAIYTVTNNKMSQDRKHAIVNLLNYDRDVVKPKKSRFLFIPISRRAKKKRLGARIPSSFVFGIDYVFAKSVKAFKGTKFIDRSIDNSIKILGKLVIKKIKILHA
jgi:hypothetical protein